MTDPNSESDSKDLLLKHCTRYIWAKTLLGVCVCSTMMGIGVAGAQSGQDHPEGEAQVEVTMEKTFGQDVEFLQRHVKAFVLRSDSGEAQVVVVPAYQGRVMTSTATGTGGTSFGWINYAHVESGKVVPKFNVYGGEERFWLGPEGGQFGLFFQPGAKFEIAQFSTPAVIDTQPYDVVSQNDRQVSFCKETSLRNYSKTLLKFKIDRSIELLSAAAASQSLGVDLVDEKLSYVGYRSSNHITNRGDVAWTKKSGLLSIWLVGMYKPGPQTTVVIPYRTGLSEELGPVVNDTYFGKVPANRLKMDDGVLFFSGDGAYRSKIGVSPQRSKSICGSYDAQRGVLTIVKYNKPEPEVTDYVNSMWEIQDKPYAGDALNAYNDGAPEPGAKLLGPFYELETSSSALALKPGESGEHIQETYHFEGSAEALDHLSKELLGVSLATIRSALQ